MSQQPSRRPWLSHYDYWVRPHLTYPQRPLSDILAAAAVDFADQPATAFLGATLTFAELKVRADRLAAALTRLGIAKGDRIGLMLPNCPQYVIGVFAAFRLGAIVVNINPAYTAREVLGVVADSGLRAVITLVDLAASAASLKTSTSLEHVIVTSLAEYSAAPARAGRVEGTLTLAELISDAPSSDLPLVPIEPDDVAVFQYTSGTTGLPRAAMLTHGNLFANVIQTETFMYPSRPAGERYLLVIPLFHIYGFTAGLLRGIWIGAQLILHPKYEVEQALNAFREFRPTYFPAVPTVYVSLLAHPKIREFGLERVRFFNTGGAPCPIDVLERWETVTGRPLNQGYGLSETSPVTHTTPQLARRRRGTVGVPIPDTDVKIVDLESGSHELAPGEPGEVCIAGPQVMKGYWRRDDETARVLRRDREGRVWFHTGDVGTMDADGFLTIVQRKTDMLIVDGFNVFPSEIETILRTHPAVQLAAVIGVADRYHGEVPKAFVVLKAGATATADELIAHCRGSLAEYKLPREVVFRESLPMTAAGKILYRELALY